MNNQQIEKSDSVKPYDKYEDLVYLFTFNSISDTERHIDERTDLYIDQKTGKIITRRFVSTDPFSIRPGSVSVYEWEKSYEDFKNILNVGVIDKYADWIKDASKLNNLSENNWKNWLIESRLN